MSVGTWNRADRRSQVLIVLLAGLIFAFPPLVRATAHFADHPSPPVRLNRGFDAPKAKAWLPVFPVRLMSSPIQDQPADDQASHSPPPTDQSVPEPPQGRVPDPLRGPPIDGRC